MSYSDESWPLEFKRVEMVFTIPSIILCDKKFILLSIVYAYFDIL